MRLEATNKNVSGGAKSAPPTGRVNLMFLHRYNIFIGEQTGPHRIKQNNIKTLEDHARSYFIVHDHDHKGVRVHVINFINM